MDEYLNNGMVDSFREFNKSPEKYSWWDMRTFSRGKNLGWRIDYQCVSEPLRQKLVHADILSEAYHSDHCPVLLELKEESLNFD